MTSTARCHECGSLLCIPGTTAPIDVDKARHLTAEQKDSIDIVCPSDKCPSRLVLNLNEILGSMENAQTEQSGDLRTLDPQEIMGGQGPQLSNNESPQQKQEEDDDLEKELRLELELFLNDPLEEFDGKPVHQGQNPCRLCYQRGLRCRRLPGSDSCITCQGNKRDCKVSLAGAKPAWVWRNRTVFDYSPPLSIHASRITGGSDGVNVLEYHVKYAFKPGVAKWEVAENLKEYTWILKKFHHDMPHMPGPADWLVEEEDDEFFYGDSDHLPM